MRIISLSILTLILALSCLNDPQKKASKKINTHEAELVKGIEIANATFNSLSSELKKAMAAGGVPQAVQYCNGAALPLTDSLAQIHNVAIKRTSDKWRNPKNKPTTEELKVINKYKGQLAVGEDAKAMIQSIDDRLVFFAPIKTQALCINCHGPKENMPAYSSIQELYPNDLATGYKPGDLRGIWSITFNK